MSSILTLDTVVMLNRVRDAIDDMISLTSSFTAGYVLFSIAWFRAVCEMRLVVRSVDNSW